MAGFPPPPSFGPAPGQRGEPLNFQYTTAQSVDYPYATALQSTNLSAFGQNSASIRPGFEYNNVPPSFNTAMLASGVPSVPIYSGLDPNAPQQNPIYGAQIKPPGIPNSHETSYTGVSTSQRPPAVQSASTPQGSTEYSATRQRPQAVEEGEISEGEYGETMGEMPVTDRGETQRSYHDYPLSRKHSWDRTITQRQRSFGKMMHLSSTDQYGRSRDTRRQSSDSYSPPSSEPPAPVLAVDRQTYPPHQSATPHNLSNIPEQKKQVSGPDERRHLSILNSLIENKKPVSNSENEPDSHTAHISPSSYHAKSVQDARRQAQNAVLNLLPLKVRFQNFIDEGIDEVVIRSVFDDIGMSPSCASTKQPSSGTEQMQHGTEFGPDMDQSFPSTSINGGVTQIHPKDTVNKGNGGTLPISNKGEERKDRIARLLEEKSKKLSNLTRPSASQQTTSSINAIIPDTTLPAKPAVSQSAIRVDKEKLLKQKMEALQKSREARAQKATAKLAPTSTISLTPTNSGQPQGPQPQPQVTSASTSIPIASPPNDFRIRSISPQQTESYTSMPSIPGLFLAGTAGTVQTGKTQNSPMGQSNSHRKRPVASDFDSNATTNATYKRPFGHNRNDKPLVIDVSEEESEDESVEMEIDDQIADVLVHDTQSANPLRPGLRDLPPLSDFPPKKSFATPSSTLGTPPNNQGPSRSSARPEDLKRKEFEIQEMRRKIAEAEQRKKAKQITSGSQTPIYKISTPVENKSAKDASISNKIDTSVQIERLIDDASRRIEEDQQKLAQAQVLEEHNAEALKQRETEQRRQRRAKIAVDLPAVDADVLKSQMRLADLRAEMENLEAAVQKRLEEKRILAEEMERLGHEVDDQLEAQKDQLMSLAADVAMEQDAKEDPSAHSIVDTQDPSKAVDETSLPNGSNGEIVAGQQCVSTPYVQPGSELPVFHAPKVNQELATPEVPIGSELSLSAAKHKATGSQSQPPDSPSVELPLSHVSNNESINAMVIDLPPRLHTVEDVDNSTKSVVSGVSASQLDFPATEQPQTPLANLNIDDTYQTSQPEMEDIEEVAIDDTESMQSEDMEIDEPYPPDSDSVLDTQEENPAMSKTPSLEANHASTVDGDSDTYEPPEATPPSSNEFIAANSTPFSLESPGSTPDVSDINHDTSLAPTDGVTEPADSAGPLLPHPSNNENEIGNAPGHKSFFTPYESPLKRFKAYRFHPEFIKEVPGGYKSLTYSNNIDTGKEFCRFELAGGVCNDVSCELQHFRDITLPDELILVALGNSAGYKEEDRMRFINGLKKVLQDLRISKIRDFQVIASKICGFRQGFLEDSSKVLLLDGQAI